MLTMDDILALSRKFPPPDRDKYLSLGLDLAYRVALSEWSRRLGDEVRKLDADLPEDN